MVYDPRYWYKADKNDVANDLSSTVEKIISDETEIFNNYRKWAALYKDKYIQGFRPTEYKTALEYELEARISYNLIKSCVDTLVSKITINKPHPQFITIDGDVKYQLEAKKLEKFVSGVLYECEVYPKAREAFRDACLYGIGILKVFPCKDRVKVKKVHPANIIVDNQFALDHEPSTLYQIDYLTKDQIRAMLPGIKDKDLKGLKDIIIEGAEPSGLIKVYEGWYKPSEGKGRHTIVAQNIVLYDDREWDDEFPFVTIRFQKDLMGWYGIGVAEELEGIQMEIHRVVDKIQYAMDTMSTTFYLVPRGANVIEDHLLTNEHSRMIEYDGAQPPAVQAAPGVNPQVFEYLERLYQKGFEIVGVSQLSAQAKKPSGLNSGIALRTYLDVESQRFVQLSRGWEEMYVDLGRKILQCAGRIAEESGFEVTYRGKEFIEKIKYEDVQLAEDTYDLRVMPASDLPQSVSGRTQYTIDILNAGMISVQEARELLYNPDIERWNKLANAPVEDLKNTFEHMLATGKYLEPLKYQNLQLGLEICTSYLAKARINGLAESRVDLLARWIDEAADLLAPPEPEAPPPGMEMPQGAPAPMEMPQPAAGPMAPAALPPELPIK